MHTKARGAVLLVVAALAGGPPRAAGQIVQGQVDGVGFATSTTPVIRPGQWFPVRVSLRAQGSQVFSGELRFTGVDLDGDRVAFIQPQVALSGESGPPKRFWAYAVAQSAGELPEAVDVIAADGGRVAELPMPAQPVAPLSADDLLVLDLSSPPVLALTQLAAPGWSPGQPSDGMRSYYRNIVLARMPVEELPDRWWGLEAVDVIVWDQPDPGTLTLAQRDALVQWVYAGGQLVLGLGASWPNLRKSELAPLLPLAGEGPLVEVSALPLFAQNMSRSRRFELAAPIPVTTAALFSDPAGVQPDAVRILGDLDPNNQPLNLVAMRLVGSGRVVTTAAGLRDLSDPQRVVLNEARFFGALLDLNPYTADFKSKQLESAQFGQVRKVLYDGVVQPVAFTSTGALSGLAAFLFVAAYVALATVASWWWLRHQGRTQLSWTVFAAFAVAASAFSLATVSLLRGLSGGVRSLGVLDLEAGQPAARGYCLFGYRSPIRQRVDLTLPDSARPAAGERAAPLPAPENFLRPLARHPTRANSYVTPARYAAVPSRAALDDVLLRATLKQLEGHWSGELPGTISGDLRIGRSTGRLTDASWIKNELPDRLAGACLLIADPRHGELRAAGLTERYPLKVADPPLEPDSRAVPPALNVLALRLPGLAPGQRLNGLGRETYERVDQNLKAWRSRKRAEMPDLPTLWHEQQSWAGNSLLGALQADLPERVRAVLLACTRNFYLHNHGADFASVGMPASGDGLPDLDITDWLLGRHAVLIAWSEAPPPVNLFRNGRAIESDAGLTFYRVRVPVTWE